MVRGYWTDVFSYVTGALRNRSLACVATVADERVAASDEHSSFLQWKAGTWGRLLQESVSWSTVDTTVCNIPVEQTLFLGLHGQVLCAGSGDVHEELIRAGQQDSPQNRGMMRGIGTVAGKAYAVGMQRQAYRRDDRALWVSIDAGARPSEEDDSVYSFEHIAGFSENEIYAAGRGGEIWLYEAGTWKQQDSPTNLVLTRLCSAGDDNVYICGRLGTLIRGRRNRWELIEHEETTDDFWGMAWFQSHLYVSTMRELYRLDSGRLLRVNFGKDIPSSCFALSAGDGVMWSIGPKDIMSYNGDQWTRID
ncbi:MAG TPA: hypothetical protein VMG82_25535 [Candidatus Sulfotelmatobacter sp.]|nr:hypothetical protein [Candidatus Sulfotelmatobacter sp.]